MFATENSVSTFVVNVHTIITFPSKCFVEERKLEFFHNCFPRCLQTLFSKTSLLPPHPFDPLYFSSWSQSYILLRYRCSLSHWDGSSVSAGPWFSAGPQPVPRVMWVVSKHVQNDEAASATVMVTARLGCWTPPALGGWTGGRRKEAPGLQIYRATCLGLTLEDSRAVSRPGWGPPGRGGADGGEREQACVASWREE